MSHEPDPHIISHPAASLTWSEVWISALTRPSVATFEGFVQDPDATTRRAYNWVFISGLISYAITALGNMVFSAGTQSTPDTSGTLGMLICVAPIVALGSVLGLALSAGITQWIASALGGTGTYSKLAYAFAAYLAPLALISGGLTSIPYLNLLSIPLSIYGIVLNVIAVKAVHQFSWEKAIASSVLILVAILALVACMVIVVLALLGPAIGNVFSEIMRDI